MLRTRTLTRPSTWTRLAGFAAIAIVVSITVYALAAYRPPWVCVPGPAFGSAAVHRGAAFGCRDIEIFTLTNRNGVAARITNYGGKIVSIRVPDRDGQFAEVVQGFDSADAYAQAGYRYGALVGRFANRIKDDTYVLDGLVRHVTADAKPYDERVWTASLREGSETSLVLALEDPDGAMGFPGEVQVTATYTLTSADTLRIDLRATTDQDTVMSLTNHAYFNMGGVGPGRTVEDQLLSVNADAFTVNDADTVPTGEIRPVAGTPFDFRQPTAIGARIDDPDPMLQAAGGYDLNFVLNGEPGVLRRAARLEDPPSGRVLEVWTTQAGLQVYTANGVKPEVTAAKGYAPHGAVTLEAQGFPNAPNLPAFPSTLVTPERPLHEVIEYRFLIARS